jgi:hypothetical protein
MFKLMYTPKIGPKTNPAVAREFHSSTSHTLHLLLKRSSTDPARTTDGTADAKPVTNRPMYTIAIDGTTPVNRQKRLKTAPAMMYGFRLPKASEYGGTIRPPSA